jgi:hypothetical protein
MAPVLAYTAAVLTGLWGVAHVVPTRQVLAGFGPITVDNRRVLLQEWLAEAFTMWGVALVVITSTALAADSSVTAWIYRVASGLLLALAALTSLTGARTPVVWFKICPVLLILVSGMLVLASIL